MEYQIVPLEVKNEVTDLAELTEWFRRIREEFSQKTSPEDRLKEIEKIDQLLEELRKVHRKLKLQSMIALGLVELEPDSPAGVDRPAPRDYRCWFHDRTVNAFIICLAGLAGILFGEQLFFICIAFAALDLALANVLLGLEGRPSYIEFLMKYRLARKTKRYLALRETIANLKRLTTSLKLTKLRLYI